MNSPSPYHRAKQVFLEVVDLPEPDRAITLNVLCADDDDLRIEVEDMLATATDPGAVAIAEGILTNDELTRSVKPGFEIPGYEIGPCIGSGGMGVVFRARQAHPQRDVAVKILRSAFPSERMRRRFDLEADILGTLHHPGIAQVFDVGKAESGPGITHAFYAMELVEGEPLCDFARSRDLSLPQRIRLMIAVCQAVHHAHRHGVIHRDLKPGNIIVNETGQPKVLDFGVARFSRDRQATMDGTVYGTLQYMSPEQASGERDVVDTRTDIYALGVIAFELFTGETPYEVPDEWSAQLATIIAEAPLFDGPFIDGSSDFDLRLILETAMCHDQEDRYQSVSDLTSDLQRLLANQPIMARPPSSWYALRKFVRRHRVSITLGLAAMLTLIIAVVNTSILMVRAQGAERDVEAALLHIGTSLAALSDENPHVVRQVTRGLDELLETSGPASAPLAKAYLHESMGRIAWRLDEPDAAQQHFQSAITLVQLAGTTDEGEYQNLVRLMLLRSKVLVESHRDEEASVLANHALAIADNPDYNISISMRLHLVLSVGEVALLRGADAEAEQIFRRVISSLPEGNDPYLELEAMNNLGVALTRQGKFDEAIDVLQEAYDWRMELNDADKERFRLARHLGVAYKEKGDVAAAFEYFEIAFFGLVKMLEPDDMLLLDTKVRLGDAMWWNGLSVEAGSHLRDACHTDLRSLDPGMLKRTRQVFLNACVLLDRWNTNDPQVETLRSQFAARIDDINRTIAQP